MTFPNNNVRVYYVFFFPKLDIKALSNTFSIFFHLQHNTCI